VEAISRTLCYVNLRARKVKEKLGHKSVKNTEIYTHLPQFESMEYDVTVAETEEERKATIKAGFQFIEQANGKSYYRKPKFTI